MSFRILGPIECRSADAALDLGGPRQLRLLALLLVNANRAVSNDVLIESLWGGECSAGAAKRLQVAIVRLRKALGGVASRVETVTGGYRLRTERRELDADAFSERVRHGRRALDAGEPALAAELLGAALALFRGPVLAEVAYEPFAQAETRRLDELRLTALAARVEADLQLGRHADVVGELELLTAGHPTHEHFARQLMLALYRSGRQADALDVYQRVRARLAERLGLEPGPALRAMQAQVLAHHAALELPREDEAPRRRAFLVLRPGDAQQRVIALDPARQLTLGRNPATDVPLAWDLKISRLHAVLERVGDAWVLSDDGLSSNGTYCNEIRIARPRPLRDGDVLRFGETLAEFREPSAAGEGGTVVTGTGASPQ